ncbi:SpoIIE family protein phosphatase [Nocardioides sp. JQ2195]|uniref:SpoIIE family protein phosphatase n=1 Tax=Nocardioides sp. JQ2195 TaxID=2592334 RepID=UPI00143EDDB3|nr:SpoIIE family protein phosphatase [Nocardioides sp. JQ2195]QIX27567.1 SpoIIE family protein phosphatase [Nocardioides sp. JQ2195]
MDAVLLPDGRTALLVADVVGHGVGAVVAIAQVRAILRQRLSTGVGLLDALRDADRYAEEFPETCATTVCLVALDQASGEAEYVCAGHLPPLWLSAAGRTQVLPGLGSRPLGTGGDFRSGRVSMGPRDALVLYTDGLNGSPGRDLLEARQLLVQVAAQAFARSLDSPAPPAQRAEDLCSQILGEVSPPDGALDDAVLLVALRAPQPDVLRITLPADLAAVSEVRTSLNDWLDGLGAGLLDHIGLTHAVTELVANAVQHAYPPGSDGAMVHVVGALDEDGAVAVTVSDRGQWLERASDGQGLMMAAGLADSMTVRRESRGTSVDLRFLLSRPVHMLQSVAMNGMPRTNDPVADLHAEASPGLLTAVGPVDEVSVELFHASMEEATRSGTADAVIDLSGVTHLSSPGVQSLFEFLGRAKRSGSSLSLVAPPESPAGQILDLVGLESRV